MSHTLSSLLALSMFLLASVLAQTPSPPSLPLPARDIPANLNPPLASGRNDYHGWLLLPWDQVYNASAPVLGWLYHHTPEFETDSPHDFEIMLAGSLKLKTPVPNLPLPPASPVLGTEYVFTPPSFSLDEMLTSKLVNFPGSLSNGSFDTPQRYKLSDGTMTVLNLTTVHYLYQNATAGYPELAYFSYPRNPSASAPTHGIQHFYFLHLEQQSPDFDQILHVTINLDECVLDSADSVQDLLQAGATFVLPGSTNKVTHRVVPASSAPTPLTVLLMTDATRYSEQHTKCAVQILEEIHCVVVPDSFANCPPVTNL